MTVRVDIAVLRFICCWCIITASASQANDPTLDPHAEPMIHFVHTSERDNNIANRRVPDMTRCAIESAIQHNLSHKILVHSRAWDLDALDDMGSSVHLVRLNLDSLFQTTEDGGDLARWYSSHKWNVGYKFHHLADAARLAILYKYGGTYMDLDIISTCPLRSAPANFVGSEAPGLLNNAVIHMNRPRHPFVRQAIRAFVRQFDPLTFGWNGPQLLTRVWKQVGGSVFGDQDGMNVDVLPPVAFYNVSWVEAFQLFGPPLSWERVRCCSEDINRSSGTVLGTGVVNESEISASINRQQERASVTNNKECAWGVHLWHSQIRAQLPFLHDLFPDSHLAQIYNSNCPITHTQLSAAVQHRPDINVALVSIQNPVAGRQYRVGMDIPVKLKVVLREPTGWFVASEHRICYVVDDVPASAQCSELTGGTPVLTLAGLNAGHHLMRAVLCGKLGADTLGDKNEDKIKTCGSEQAIKADKSNTCIVADDLNPDSDSMKGVCLLGGNSEYISSVGVGSVVAFNVDFQNAWER